MGMKKVSEQLMVLDNGPMFILGIVLGILFLGLGIGNLVSPQFPNQQGRTLAETSPFIFSIIVALVGITILFLLGRKTTVKLDKATGKMLVEEITLFGGRNEALELSAIQEISFTPHTSDRGVNPLGFRLKESKILYYRGMISTHYEASRIAEFLGVPVYPPDPILGS